MTLHCIITVTVQRGFVTSATDDYQRDFVLFGLMHNRLARFAGKDGLDLAFELFQ